MNEIYLWTEKLKEHTIYYTAINVTYFFNLIQWELTGSKKKGCWKPKCCQMLGGEDWKKKKYYFDEWYTETCSWE